MSKSQLLDNLAAMGYANVPDLIKYIAKINNI